MRINSVPDVKCFCNNKMCYVHNQWYDISCATLYFFMRHFQVYNFQINYIIIKCNYILVSFCWR